MRRTPRAGDGTRAPDLPVHQPRVLGLSATAPFAPSPFRSAHAHGLAEKAGELRSVLWIVGLLVTLRLRGEFGDWRDQLAVRTKESGGIGGIEGDPEVDADGPPPRRDCSKKAPAHVGQ